MLKSKSRKLCSKFPGKRFTERENVKTTFQLDACNFFFVSSTSDCKQRSVDARMCTRDILGRQDNAVADPDLHITGGGGGGGAKKNFFRPFGPQFALTIRGEGSGPPGPSPGSATA